jgi:two-component system chemotaxis sensor kinase CheA
MVNDNREFIEEFLVESTENLDQLDRDLLALEKTPDDQERLASIFRTVHTIKGNSGFFGFSKLGALTHSGEHLLGRLRDGKLQLDDRVAGSLYLMVDAVRSILQSIETTGSEGQVDLRDLTTRLSVIAAESTSPPVEPPSPRQVAPLNESTEPAASLSREVGEPSPLDGAGVAAETSQSADRPAESAPASSAAESPQSVAPGVAKVAEGAVPAPSAPQPAVAEASIRVDVDLLTWIHDLVGELVLARNQLRSIETDDAAIQAVGHKINAVTNALQEAAVKTRMQPIEHFFSKFPRIVRDLAVACGKEVQFVVEGTDTELDRTLVDSIRDPLTHLIRNAVDHGIERPEIREQVGKPRSGRIALRAFNENGQVTIEVEDDGAGMSVQAVRDKIIARGLVSPAAANAMSDDRVLQFIFEPGFSTSETVTSISGRGVGMDVVKTNIEAIGGAVDIHSRRGLGSTIRIRVPLTLAILPALVLRCHGQSLAIPQAVVSELLPLRPDRAEPRIEGFGDTPVMRVHGRLLPVRFLSELLGLRHRETRPDSGTVVLLRVDDREFGLVIDRHHGGERADRPPRGGVDEVAALTTIVVKPLGSLLSQIGVYAGATVLGDGGIALVLDPRGLARAADLPPATEGAEATAGGERDADWVEAGRYVVCRTNGGRRVAVPLVGVTRLENIPATQLQPVAGRQVVRRGAEFTPVLDVDALLGFAPSPPAEWVHLLISGDVALAVHQILDVCQADSQLQPTLSMPGVAGSLSLGGVATEVLDLDTVTCGVGPPRQSIARHAGEAVLAGGAS